MKRFHMYLGTWVRCDYQLCVTSSINWGYMYMLERLVLIFINTHKKCFFIDFTRNFWDFLDECRWKELFIISWTCLFFSSISHAYFLFVIDWWFCSLQSMKILVNGFASLVNDSKTLSDVPTYICCCVQKKVFVYK
jgi:hypothetical protein